MGPSWPTNEDRLREQEQNAERPRRNLVKQCVFLRQPQAEQVFNPDFMEKHKYSVQVYPLKEDTPNSGFGEDRGYCIYIYYEPRDEQNMIRVFKGININIQDGERGAVDPDTMVQNEQDMMH